MSQFRLARVGNNSETASFEMGLCHQQPPMPLLRVPHLSLEQIRTRGRHVARKRKGLINRVSEQCWQQLVQQLQGSGQLSPCRLGREDGLMAWDPSLFQLIRGEKNVVKSDSLSGKEIRSVYYSLKEPWPSKADASQYKSGPGRALSGSRVTRASPEGFPMPRGKGTISGSVLPGLLF